MPRLDLVSFHERWSSTAGKHAVQRSLMPAAGSKLLSSLSMAILYGLYSKTYHAARELNLLKVLRPFFFFFHGALLRGFAVFFRYRPDSEIPMKVACM